RHTSFSRDWSSDVCSSEIKNRIVERVLKGEAYGPATNGIVPPAIKDYDYSSVIGLDFNPEKAKKALADPGYNEKNPFPKLEIVRSEERRVGKECRSR